MRDETVQIDDLPFSQRNACETEPLHAKDWPTIWFAELMLKPALQSSPSTVPISVSTPFFQRNPCTAESGVSSLVVESSCCALSTPQRAQVDELVVMVLVSLLILSGKRNRARRHHAHCNCGNPHQPSGFHWVSPFQSDESALGARCLRALWFYSRRKPARPFLSELCGGSLISSETFVKPTSAELCVNREAEQIVWVTRNGELASSSSKAC